MSSATSRASIKPTSRIVGTVINIIKVDARPIGTEPVRVQRCATATQQQRGHKLDECILVGEALGVDVKLRRRHPQAVPPQRQHTGAHGIPRRQEGHNTVEQLVGEPADPVPHDAHSLRDLQGHSIEQKVCRRREIVGNNPKPTASEPCSLLKDTKHLSAATCFLANTNPIKISRTRTSRSAQRKSCIFADAWEKGELSPIILMKKRRQKRNHGDTSKSART